MNSNIYIFSVLQKLINQNKKEESESDEESDTSNANNNNIEKTIFNETVKKKIEKYSPINTSMALPESDTKLKPDDSGLLITSSNETSLINIMKGMSHPHPHPSTHTHALPWQLVAHLDKQVISGLF